MATARDRQRPAEAEADAGATATLIAPQENAEALLRSALDALSANVAVLDEDGKIIAVNQAWRDFAVAAGYRGDDHGVGTNYLGICERSAGEEPAALRTVRGLRDVISGRRRLFRVEYLCSTPQGPRWFELRASAPRAAAPRRIVIAHEDITHLKRAEEALAALNGRLMRLQDDERRSIARELHDVTAQNLLAITLQAARLAEGSGPGAKAAAAEIVELAETSLQEVRTLCYLVHPPLLDDVGLEAALRWLARGFGERSGIAVEERVEELGVTLTQEAATALFRVAQEALLNVNRHSGSAWVRVTLRPRGDAVELVVDDAGRGIEALEEAEPGGVDAIGQVGVGIAGMRVRLGQLGGSLEILPRQPGLRLRGTLPLGPNRAAGPGDG